MINRIFNIISWVGLALVGAAVAIKFGFPARDQYVNPLAIAGLVCVLAYALSQWRDIVGMFAGRQARYGTLTGVSVIVVLGILVAINYIGKRQNKRWDLTTTKQYSLSDQTRNVVAKLDAPLHILVFDKETEFQRYRDRLREYEYASKQVSTEYVDPDKKRTITQQNGVTQYGTLVFSYKDRSERVTSDNEQDITNGIIKVVTGKQKKVFFTLGHGEKDTAAADRNGYSQIVTALGHENYTVEKIVLAQQASIPADAAVLVIAGPKIDFLAGEIDVLKKYLANAGKLLLELDPPDKVDSAPLTNLVALAHEWGIDVGNNVVVDVSGMGRLIGTSEAMPVAASYPTHPITERFNNIMTVYPLARSVTPVKGGVDGHTALPVVETSDRSWAETNLKDLFASKPVELNEAQGDTKGPVGIAAAVSAPSGASEPPKPGDTTPKPETRVVVFGDSDYVANATLRLPGNSDLFMNTIGWLSQQENLISIRPKEASDRRITMTAAQQTNVNILALFGIPGVIFGTGIYNWLRRR
jgi:ABC-type uncharacterized transport system involved in gliding motility auxiliary subunit